VLVGRAERQRRWAQRVNCLADRFRRPRDFDADVRPVGHAIGVVERVAQGVRYRRKFVYGVIIEEARSVNLASQPPKHSFGVSNAAQ